MKTSRLSAALMTSFGLLMAISAASPDCWAQNDILFVGDCHDAGCMLPNNPSTDFNLASNWDPAVFPNANEKYLIQDNRTAVFSSGNTTLGELTVSHDSFGRLRMTGGSLTLLNPDSPLEVAREQVPLQPKSGDYNINGIVDSADYTVWRDTLGQFVNNPGDGADGDESLEIDAGDYDFWKARFGLVTRGGEVIMTGSSILTTNGAVIGRRTKGLLSVDTGARVDVKGANFVGGVVRSRDLEVGSYGRGYFTALPGQEPGLAAEGLAIVKGTVNADGLTINVFGAIGELRVLPGGRVNLNGALVLSHCDTATFTGGGCGLKPNPEPLMSSKVSIIGSGGTFEVGKFDANLSTPSSQVHDFAISRDIRSEYPSTATFSFTADAGGVTTIVLVKNSDANAEEFTGTAYLDGTVGNVVGTYARINLELNLDAFPFTPTSRLTLIDAPPDLPGVPPAHLVGVFDTETYMLGTTTRADVNYDYLNGDVYLDNFRIGPGAGAGSLAGAAVPEPSSLAMMILTLGLVVVFSFRAEAKRQPARIEDGLSKKLVVAKNEK